MDVLNMLGSGALNFIMIVLAILFFGLLSGAIVWWLTNKRLKEQYEVIIFDNNGIVEKDKAGIYKSWKTKNRLLFLKKNKVGLNPDNVPYKQVGRAKYIFLQRTGLKRFQYITFEPDKEDLSFSVSQEDLNWANEEYEKSKKAFQSSLLMQILPIISVVVVSMIILIMVIYVLKKMDVLLDVSANLKETANILAQAKMGVIS